MHKQDRHKRFSIPRDPFRDRLTPTYRQKNNNESKLSRKMGYISNVNDAKEILEKLYKKS